MEAFLPVFKIFGFSLLAGIVFAYLKYFKKKPKNWTIEILANFLGSLFIFSGIVKAIDPLGTSYKMKDYFDAFSQFTGFSFDWLSSMSTFFAVFMIVLEIVLGIALIIGFKKKITIGLSAAMMIFFTVLTGFTYLTGFMNPDYYDIVTRHELQAAGEDFAVFVPYDKLQMKVTDCGCFGDFLKLEPKVTFIKDVFLMFVLIALIAGMKNIQQFFGNTFSWVKVGGGAIFFLLFCFSNYIWGLPIIDFRPYKVGNDINALRVEIPDKLDYGFIFKNQATGETKRVVMADYAAMKADEAWEFTNEQDNIVLEKGVPAKIANFGAYDEDGYDVTDDLLLNEEYSFWVLSKNMKESNGEAWAKLNILSDYADANNKEMFGFMTLNFDEAEELRHEYQIPYTLYQADETFIKTVVRSNPGLVLLKNGFVMGKWHHNNIPNAEEMDLYIKSLN
jgi:uncharacterized membrane protein YphA (DoxX/SURF4 family)